MGDDIPRLIARLAEAVRDTPSLEREEASEAAVQLRQVADRIENSTARSEQRPWWDNPDEDDAISHR